jgi:NTE family protein
MADMKVGLVLSGGGAKGAWQAGLVRALAELGVQVDVVAGASIGALNGAIVASAGTLEKASEHLETLWSTLAQSSPVSFNPFGYLTMLASAGSSFALPRGVNRIADIARLVARRMDVPLPEWVSEREIGIASDEPLKRLMDEYLDPDALRSGLPLYVSLFRSNGAMADLLDVASAELGFPDTAESEFVHVQALPVSEQRTALLGSAAIPVLFAAKEVGGVRYSDGGMGGWQTMQGNTPMTPLLEAGCDTIIVTHLSDGSLWSRQAFAGVRILEIRPQRAISREASLLDHRDLLGFHAEKIPSWIHQGYEDTLQCIGRVMQPAKARNALCRSEQQVVEAEQRSVSSEAVLASAMARLRRSR